jgi:hypothetical protein
MEKPTKASDLDRPSILFIKTNYISSKLNEV